MRYRSVRHLFLLILGALVALGIGLAAVQAQSMAAQMSRMAPDMISSAEKTCEHCQAGMDMTMPCATVCVAQSVALLAAQDPILLGTFTARLPIPGTELPLGVGQQPPHSPPRTTYIG